MRLVNSKYITAQGKTKLLQLGFQNNTSGQFRYLALGGEGSNAAVMEDAANFYEISGENYQRVPLEQEGSANNDTQSITLSAIFEDTNYNHMLHTRMTYHYTQTFSHSYHIPNLCLYYYSTSKDGNGRL